MAGGDFLSRAEGSACLQHKIEDRVKVHQDLNAIIRRHGDQGAHAQLGLMPGDITLIIARRKAITADLLTAMYEPGKARLREGFAATVGLDAGVAKVLAAARGGSALSTGAATRRAPARVMSVPEAKVVAKTLSAAIGVTATALPAPTHAPSPVAEDGAALIAILERARVQLGGRRYRAADAIGIGASTFGFLASGARSFTPVLAQLVRAWDAANPVAVASNVAAIALDPLPLSDEQRAAVETIALAQFYLTRDNAVAIIAAARGHGLSLREVGERIGCQPTHVTNLISGNRAFTSYIAEKLLALRDWSAAKGAERDEAAAAGELDTAGADAPADTNAEAAVAGFAEDRGVASAALGTPPLAPDAVTDAAPPADIELLAAPGGETMVAAALPPMAALPSSPLFDSEDPVASMLTLLQQQHEAARIAETETEAQAKALAETAAGLMRQAVAARFKVVRLRKAIDALTELAA